MLDLLLARWKQGSRTMRYPDGPPPELPDRFAGRPVIDIARCEPNCLGQASDVSSPRPLAGEGQGVRACCEESRPSARPAAKCINACPTGAIAPDAARHSLQLDLGRCLFCRDCEAACPSGAIAFTREYRLAASARDDLLVRGAAAPAAIALDAAARRLFGRSLKLRQVSAGGCNACEADTNVLGTVAWDLGRFGVQFVASPRHADGLLITGPVTRNMQLALQKTYEAVPWPKLVVAVGACAISGGPYIDHPEVGNGAASQVPVDLFIPGCPPHPLTILEGLLALLGRVERNRASDPAHA